MFNSVGKVICELFHVEVVVVDLSSFEIKDTEQMKLLLLSAWHAKQKETKTEHPPQIL